MPSFEEELKQQLALRKAQHLLRQRVLVDSPQGASLTVNGESLRCFCSNDYLGLAKHPAMVEALKNSADDYGVGGGASHLVCGHHQAHHQLEIKLAEFTGRDKALLFSTGYMANLAILSSLLDKNDAIFQDKLNHASLIDGGALCGAKLYRFAHNDLAHLESRLQKADSLGAKRKLICVDAVFSMDGDKAPLKEIAALAKKYNAIVMADDAHGFGVLGENGAGLCEELGLSQLEVPIIMGTLGKAVGSFGAFVAGSDALIETLVQFARPYIYTTAMPPAVAAATQQGIELIIKEPQRRKHLQALIKHFKQAAEQHGLQLMPSETAIQPLLIGDEALAVKWQQALYQQGFWISAIRTPTVAKGAARLRITLSAAHSLDDVDALINALIAVREQFSGKPYEAAK